MKLNVVIQSTRILTSQIDDIMDVAKLDQGAFSVKNEEFSLRELIEEVKNIFEIQIRGKNLEFWIVKNYENISMDLKLTSDKKRIR